MKKGSSIIRTSATASGVTDEQPIFMDENAILHATASGVTDEQPILNDNNAILHATASGAADDPRPRTTPTRGEKPHGCSVPTKTSLHFGTLNIRTLAKPGKLDLALRELQRYNWDVIGLSETHLPRTSEENLSGASLLLSGRKDGVHRQGVGFFVSSTAKKSLISFTPVSERIAVLRLKGAAKNISVVQVYAPDSARSEEECDEFYFTLQSVIDQIHKKDVLIVMGDFNAIVGMDNTGRSDIMGTFGHGKLNARGERLLDFCRENELFLTNTIFKHRHRRKVTWRSPDGKTENMIDYILISKRWKSSVLDTVALPGADFDSDHTLLMSRFKLRMRKLQKATKIPRFRLDLLRDPAKRQTYTSTLSEKFREILKNHSPLTTANEIDSLTEQATSAIIETANDVLGRKTPNEKPWITDEIIALCEDKRLFCNKSDRHSWDTYKLLKRRVEREIRKALRNHLRKKCEDCEVLSKKGNSGAVFRMVRELSRKKEPQTSVILDKDGNEIYDSKMKLERWKEYFNDKLNPPVAADPKILTRFPIPDQELRPPPPLKSETESAIKSLKQGKAPGPDGVTAELINVGSDDVTDLYHAIVSAVWETGHVPRQWCKAAIVPIHKKGSKKECGNYRPISLTSHQSRVLTKILLRRIQATTAFAIGEYQAGFRPGRSTIDQIFVVRQLMERHIEFNQELYQLFVDFRQAFDLIWREGLWHILLHYGIPYEIVQIIKSLYDQFRGQVITVDGLSEEFTTSSGVLQGCILSPHLFNLFLNAVLSMMQSEYGATIGGVLIENLAYADDIDELANSTQELQAQADKLYDTTKPFGMEINASKTKVMVTTRRELDNPPIITIGGRQVETVDHFLYLGSLLSSDNCHSSDVKRRLALASSSFRRLANLWKSNHLSNKLKMRLFNSLVIPIVIYGCETWTLKTEDEIKLLAFEVRCLRRISRIKYTDRITNVEVRQRLQSTETILSKIKKQQLRWFGHVKRMEPSRLPKIALEGSLHGLRPRGRPRKRWMENFHFDNVKIAQLSRIAPDRAMYRALTHELARGVAPKRPTRMAGT